MLNGVSTTRRLSPIAAVVVLALVAVGCSNLRGIRGTATTTAPTTTTSSTTTIAATTAPLATTTTAALPYPVPALGTCRGVVADGTLEALVDARPPVSCGSPHGGETVAVLLSALVAIEEYPATRADVPEGLAERAAGECQIAFDGYVSLPPLGARGRASSRLAAAWFGPPPEDWDVGARWVRCDAVVAPVPGESSAFSGTIRGALAGGVVPLPLAACYDRKVQRTRCDAAHAYEAIVDAVFGAADERPDDDTIDAVRVDQCDTAAAAAIDIGTMAEQPALMTELVIPTAKLWNAGERFAICMVTSVDGRDLNDSVRGLESVAPPFALATTTTTTTKR